VATPEAFAAACQDASQALRRLPAQLHDALEHRMAEEVAAPLAAGIAAAWSGPYAGVLSAGTKATVAAPPEVIVGGSYPRLSGGAGPSTLVFGTEFGAGSRRGTVRAHTRRGFGVRSYQRVTTNQLGPAQHAVSGTVADQLPAIEDKIVNIVTDTFNKVVPGA
jgi:hypothetical protein